jgi:hypothetical protein
MRVMDVSPENTGIEKLALLKPTMLSTGNLEYNPLTKLLPMVITVARAIEHKYASL